jgi:hypothetical protein
MQTTRSADRGRGRRIIALGALVLTGALVGAGCADEDPGPSKLISQPSAEQQKNDYMEAFGAMQATIEDPSAPPVEQSINTGNRKELLNLARHWDDATAKAAAIQPPEEIAAEHNQLVKAMKGLGDWNRQIAAAAPNKAKVKATFKQAQKSEASKNYGAALEAMVAKDYQVFGDPDATEEVGIDGAGGPGG